jgi:hypothetical protein
MVWITALILIAPLALLALFPLGLGRADEGWREGAEGLRERRDTRDEVRSLVQRTAEIRLRAERRWG